MSTHGSGSGSRSGRSVAEHQRAYSNKTPHFGGNGWDKLDQRMQRWLGKEGVSNDGKWYRVYHGTQAKNVESIRENGLRSPDGAFRWYMLTTREDDANGFARGGPERTAARVLEYHIPVSEASKYLGVGVPGNHYGADQGTYHFLMQPIPGKWIAAVHQP